MQRRQFLKAIGTAAAASVVASTQANANDRAEPFRLKYAPHFGMFQHSAGDDLVAQLEFAADQGFRAWEDNQMATRPVEVQQRVAQAMERLGIEMGTISALNRMGYNLHFASDDREARQQVLEQIGRNVVVARRVGAKVMTLVMGMENPKLPYDYQMAAAVDLLLRACDVVEPHGITLVMEPLNHRTNHPGVFLHSVSQAYLLCRAVRRPGCKILCDLYHEQIECGNLVPTIDRAWDEIAYYQSGDNPGRKEPGTGEINYKRVFQHLYDRGYRGIVGMEHGNARPGVEGERAVIAAYRAVDPS